MLKWNKVVGAALATALFFCVLFPSVNAFAAANNPYITRVTVRAVGTVFTAKSQHAKGVAVEYAFVIQPPRGGWKVVKWFSSQDAFRWTPPSKTATGIYHVVATALTTHQVAENDTKQLVRSSSVAFEVSVTKPSPTRPPRPAPSLPITLTLERVTSRGAVSINAPVILPIDTPLTLAVVASDSHGIVPIPVGIPVWTVTPYSGAEIFVTLDNLKGVIDMAGFAAQMAGPYVVSVTLNGTTLSAVVWAES